MRDSVFTGEVVLDVRRPLRPAWIGAVLLSLLVIGWSISHSIPAVLAGCALLGAALVGRMREGRLQSLRLDAHGDWFGSCDAGEMRPLAPGRQIVMRDLIFLGFRVTAAGLPHGNAVLTPATAGDAVFRRLAARLRFGAQRGASH